MKVIYPYIAGSQSARLLAQAMGIRRLRRAGSRWVGTARDYIINWGSHRIDTRSRARVINNPGAVAEASNKIAAFSRMTRAGVRTPRWTTARSEAQAWNNEGRDGRRIIVRRLTSASEGRGIEVVEPRSTVPPAPLYTQYIPKDDEWRVHVMRGQVIDSAKKLLRRGGARSYVRNTANGYIFARQGLTVPPDVAQQSVAAVAALGLDFGAVDVVIHKTTGEAHVLEVNTAPGIEGTTLRSYVAGFNSLFN